ncbi:MAG: hypothetical protein IKG40_00080 [Bacilli bacterium]|nr:hypothetical protein [Bacilli bacterium]
MKNKISKGLIVQIILLIILIIFVMLTIFNQAFLPIVDFIAGLTFFIIAYNKKNDYSKFMQIILILFGLIFISFGVFNIING